MVKVQVTGHPRPSTGKDVRITLQMDKIASVKEKCHPIGNHKKIFHALEICNTRKSKKNSNLKTRAKTSKSNAKCNL